MQSRVQLVTSMGAELLPNFGLTAPTSNLEWIAPVRPQEASTVHAAADVKIGRSQRIIRECPPGRRPAGATRTRRAKVNSVPLALLPSVFALAVLLVVELMAVMVVRTVCLRQADATLVCFAIGTVRAHARSNLNPPWVPWRFARKRP